MKKSILLPTLVSSMALVLSACGGGGSDEGAKSDPDTIAPVITITGGNLEINQNAIYNDAGATAEDNVDGSVEVTTVNNVNTSEVGVHTVTYTAIDEAGNEATAVRTVVVQDVTPPKITVIGGTSKVVEGEVYNDVGANAEDAVDGSVAVVSTSIDTSVAGVKTITYTAIDAAGNSAIATRSVKVMRPSSFDLFDGTWRGSCVATNVLPGATNAKQEFVLEAGKLTNKLLAYNSSDCTGEPFYDASATADVEFGGQVNTGVCIAESIDTDITSAIINGRIINPADIQEFINATKYPVFNLFCLNSDGDLLSGDVSGANDGSSEANRPTEMGVTADVSFAKVDTIVPEITIIGHDNITIDVGTTYVDAGATATDNQDGDLTVSVTDPVDTNIPDTYEVVYEASDSEGNTTTAKRVVKVVRGDGTFSAFDGEWVSECISNTNPALAAVGVRALTKRYIIVENEVLSMINGYSVSNCSGKARYQGQAALDVVYRGEVDEAACATGKAEKVDMTIAEANINNGPALSDEDIKTFMEASQFPIFNLICIDGNDELREGNVVGELNGLKESKRPNEIDMTGAGLVKQ